MGNYTNSMAVGTGTVGNFILLSPFDQIIDPNIRDCQGTFAYSDHYFYCVLFISSKLEISAQLKVLFEFVQ